jgi:hypothetical protein
MVWPCERMDKTKIMRRALEMERETWNDPE